MFIPGYYKVKDVQEVVDFIQEHSFGTLVSMKGGRPIATHIPMILKQVGDEFILTGHMAYGNPQWRTFDTCEEVLVMFQGPHAYISSSWYRDENVPTWNYQAVHVYGKASRMEKEELIQEMTGMLEKYEKHRSQPVLWDTLSPELVESQLKGVVGFKIVITDMEAAYKLSQNRNEEDRQNIITQLQQEPDAHSRQMAEVMKRRR
ncbi:FMN-binding negative transcriptional regulator [Rossellomorea sp. AcN35-11]|nr:FMN-binding negative transcriptional regulator [Rossellomorea aquimaris]WJV29819.1 FMN-binding negative transcriptional regulator [Rossellomorea sp. AcN35-11]